MRTSTRADVFSAEDSTPMPARRREPSSEVRRASVVGLERPVGRQLPGPAEPDETPRVLRAIGSTVRPPAVKALPNLDGGFAPAVTASAEEIRYAQELRRELHERYLNRPTLPVSWVVCGRRLSSSAVFRAANPPHARRLPAVRPALAGARSAALAAIRKVSPRRLATRPGFRV